MYYFLETYEFNNSLYCLHYEYMFFFTIYRKNKIYYSRHYFDWRVKVITWGGGMYFFCEFHMYFEVLGLVGGWKGGGWRKRERKKLLKHTCIKIRRFLYCNNKKIIIIPNHFWKKWIFSCRLVMISYNRQGTPMKNMNSLSSCPSFSQPHWNYYGAVRLCISRLSVSLTGLSTCVSSTKTTKFLLPCLTARYASTLIKVARTLYTKVPNTREVMRLSMKRDVVQALLLSGLLQTFRKVGTTILIVIKRTRVRRWESYISFRSLIFPH